MAFERKTTEIPPGEQAALTANPDALRAMVTTLVQETIRAEFDRFVGAAPYERTPERRDHVGAAAPVAADWDAQAGGAGLHVLRHRGDQPVADHVERDLARGAGGDRDHHVLARRIFGLVEQIGRAHV